MLPFQCGENSEISILDTLPKGIGFAFASPGGIVCYLKCKTGYTGYSFLCWQDGCPDGFRDDGMFCAKPMWSHEWRGTSYSSMSNCESDYPPLQSPNFGCDECGWLYSGYYPKCTNNLTVSALSCNFCDAQCWDTQTDIGASCAKHTEGRLPHPPSCDKDEELDMGLCYPKCSNPSFKGIGPVCWQSDCPIDKNGHAWVQCGLGCAYDEDTCAGVTTEQVFTVLESAYTIWETASTGGGNQVTKKGREASTKLAKKKIRDEFKDWFKDQAKGYAKEQAKEKIKEKFQDTLAKVLKDDTVLPEASDAARTAMVIGAGKSGGILFDLVMGVVDPYEKAGLNSTEKDELLASGHDIPSQIKDAVSFEMPEVDMTDFGTFMESTGIGDHIDPFGLWDVIKAYKHVLCDDDSILGTPTPAPTSTSKPSTSGTPSRAPTISASPSPTGNFTSGGSKFSFSPLLGTLLFLVFF